MITSRFTDKGDWLADYLADQPKALISGHPGFAEALGLAPAHAAALRFVGNRNRVYVLLLTIQCPSGDWPVLAGRLRADKGRALLTDLRQRLARRIDVILYDNSNSERFGLSTDLDEFHSVTSKRLVRHFADIDQQLTDNPGVDKAINRTINDAFQAWTRVNLSRFVVVNDFDALLLRGITVVLELKRVQEALDSWRPYVDDSSNYATLSLICAGPDLELRVIAYNAGQSDTIAVHQVEKATKDRIVGKMVVTSPEHLLTALPAKAYESERRRD